MDSNIADEFSNMNINGSAKKVKSGLHDPDQDDSNGYSGDLQPPINSYISKPGKIHNNKNQNSFQNDEDDDDSFMQEPDDVGDDIPTPLAIPPVNHNNTQDDSQINEGQRSIDSKSPAFIGNANELLTGLGKTVESRNPSSLNKGDPQQVKNIFLAARGENKLIAGEYYYLISSKWFKQFNSWMTSDNDDQLVGGEQIQHHYQTKLITVISLILKRIGRRLIFMRAMIMNFLMKLLGIC